MTTAVKLRKLRNEDRCDRCGARAQVLVLTPAGELTFCGHHASEHSVLIFTKGYTTTSEREDGHE